jgi:seryl-tRNA synthetase
MLQVATIREQREKVITGLKKRGLKNVEDLIDKAIALDTNRKDVQKQADDLKAKSNAESKKIGDLMKNGKADEATLLRTAVASDKELIKKLEGDLGE